MVSRWIVLLLSAAPVASLSPAREQDNGASLQELRFTDAAGEHLVRFERTAVTTRKKPDDDEQDYRSQTLTVVHTVGAKELWRAKDFVTDCEFDLQLDVNPASIEVSDADGDGEAEVSFLYVLTCISDVSPRTAKLLLYEGSTKYALRGETREQVGEKTFEGGTFKADPAFNKAPKLLSFAKAKWQRLVVDAKKQP